MPVQIPCPNAACGKLSTLPDAYRGRAVRCPICRFKFKVPEESVPLVETLDTCLRADAETVAPPPAVSIERIGRFIIHRRLGSGAFGDVYHADDPQLQRAVALKVPRGGILDKPYLVERFLREGKAAAGLNHPNIVPVFDAGQDGSVLYLASAYIDGCTLAEAHHREPFDCERAARVVQRLAEAVGYAHSMGIVHRDIKPANVLLDVQGEPHLADFGLAHRQEMSDRLTLEGALLGTPAYMAPEQAAGQTGVPLPASDQYSLGVVLYELLTGKPPYEGPPAVVLYNVMNLEPDPPRLRDPKVPRDLETICLKAMARRPDRRYTNCQELADDLRRWLEGEPIRARRRNPLLRLVRWGLRKPKLTALGTLTAICLLVVSRVAADKAEELAGIEEERAGLLAETEAEVRVMRERAAEADAGAAKAKAAADRAAEAELKARQRNHDAEVANKHQERDTEAIREAQKEAKEQESQARKLLYETRIELAARAVDRNDHDRAVDLLVLSVPAAGEEDQRDDKWFDLRRRIRQGRLLYSLPGGKGRGVRGAAFSRDIQRLAAIEPPFGVVRVRDAAAGEESLILKRQTNNQTSVVFSPDGRKVAAGNRLITVWDGWTGADLKTLKGHNGTVLCLAFSNDGERLISGSSDHTARVWNTQTGDEVLTLEGHTAPVVGVAFSPNRSAIATRGRDGTLRLWNPRNGKQTHSVPGNSEDAPLLFSPDGKFLLTVETGGVVQTLHAATGQPAGLILNGDNTLITCMAFSADGKYLATGSNSGKCLVWDWATGKELFSFAGHTDRVLVVAFQPDGRVACSIDAEGNVRRAMLFDIAGVPMK